jgi:hypothetical protein
MTAQNVQKKVEGIEAHIEHNPVNGYSVLTGFDGGAFYEPLSIRVFETLKRLKVISAYATNAEGRIEKWSFTRIMKHADQK